MFDFFNFRVPQAHNGIQGFKSEMDREKDSETPDYRYPKHVLKSTAKNIERARREVQEEIDKRTPEQQKQVEEDRNWLNSLFG